MKTSRFSITLLIPAFLGFFACADLEVENLNNPDYETAITEPTLIRGLAEGFVRTWFMTTQDYDSPALAFWVAADAGTSSWGNAGMMVSSNEPRLVFNNDPTYEHALITESFYNRLNSLLSQTNDALIKLEKEGMVIMTGGVDETEMVKAVAYFTQGLSIGYLGLVYDKCFPVTHETDLAAGVKVEPYSVVIEKALQSLDSAIRICEDNTFSLPPGWIPSNIEFTSENFGKLANSFAARILAYSPRNKSQNDALNWQKVYDYASKGIDFDFSPIADAINWFTWYHDYANAIDWGQVDMRVVNMMDPRMPGRWPGANGFDVVPAPFTSVSDAGIFDKRIVTDCQPLSSTSFRPERGYYHFSNFRFKRRDQYLATLLTPMPEFYKAENDLLMAEALVYLDRLSEARTIINNGTRVTRGGLPDVAATAEALQEAIFHERNVELFCSGFGIEFFTMRKADKLQEGTFLHLPIPGSQLQAIVMPIYTFGADQGVPGVDVSNGGWFK